jgi:hypothetical protein
MSLITTKRRGRLAAVLSIPALLIMLTGCAVSSPQAGSPETPASSKLSFSDWQLANTKCMRAQGIDMPDPSADGSSQAMSMSGTDASAIIAAQKKCQEKLGPPPALSSKEKAADSAAAMEALIKVAQCYRASGVDVPDPKPGEGLKVPSDAPSDVVAKCGAGAGTSAGQTGQIGGN